MLEDDGVHERMIEGATAVSTSVSNAGTGLVYAPGRAAQNST